MLLGYVVMLLAAVTGRVPVAEVTGMQLAYGLTMVGLWRTAIVAGHTALLRQF